MGSITKTAIAQLADAVATELGADFIADGPDRDGKYHEHAHRVLGPDEQSLFLRVGSFGRERGRLIISGGFPANAMGLSPSAYPRIGVTRAATPARVAAEIRRRLLPTYATVLDEYRNRIQEAASHEKARDQLARELADGLRVVVHRGRHDAARFTVTLDDEVGTSLDVDVIGPSRVDVRIDHLNALQARRLLAWVGVEHLFGQVSDDSTANAHGARAPSASSAEQIGPSTIASTPVSDSSLLADIAAAGLSLRRSALTIPHYRLRLVSDRAVSYARGHVNDASSAAAVLHALLDDADREHIVAIYLSARNVPIGCETVAVGGLSMCAVAPRDLLKGAVVANAHALVIGHNHPSGRDPAPSDEDIAFTTAMKRAADVVGIPLVDHVIVSPDGRHASLFELGLLEEAGW
jgi:DNA repair protein RadC